MKLASDKLRNSIIETRFLRVLALLICGLSRLRLQAINSLALLFEL
jgi:hypothetical protein